MRHAVSLVALFAATILAFGSMDASDSSSGGEQEAAQMTSPWTDMALPVGGTITDSDDSTLNVEYKAHSPVPDLKRDYVAALTADGWTVSTEDDGSNPDFISMEFAKGDSSVSMTIMSIGDVSVDVDLSYSE